MSWPVCPWTFLANALSFINRRRVSVGEFRGAGRMNERKELAKAVRGVCMWCQGQCWRLVVECAATTCSFHACRLCTDDGEVDFVGAIREFCLACAGSVEAVDACSAAVPFGCQPPCPIHSYRMWRPGRRERVRSLPGLSVSDRGNGSLASAGGAVASLAVAGECEPAPVVVMPASRMDCFGSSRMIDQPPRALDI